LPVGGKTANATGADSFGSRLQIKPQSAVSQRPAFPQELPRLTVRVREISYECPALQPTCSLMSDRRCGLLLKAPDRKRAVTPRSANEHPELVRGLANVQSPFGVGIAKGISDP
jgi:hypothetical protein